MLGIWRLQLLREVARRGTIKAAAAAMSVTPSAVSQQLKLLELEAGVPLLEPHGRRVRLTDAGQMLVRHADAITAAIAAAESELAATRDAISGTLRVAAFPTAARVMMPRVLASLGARHPELRLTFRDLETDESLLALQMDEIDLAVVDEYDDRSRIRAPGVETIAILRDPLYVAFPPGRTPPAGRVRLTDLASESWIMDTEASTIFQVIARACERAGFEPHIRAQCKDYGVIHALVGSGLGMAILPGLALHDRPGSLRVTRTSPPLERTVFAAVRPERRAHPAVAAMLAELEAFATEYHAETASTTPR
jgi:DNA-binding transcriptional LysR family regulator